MPSAVVTFGRFNPPTVGHEKLVDKIKSEAKKLGAKPFVYLSHSQDAKKNPLSYDDKVKIAKKAFGPSIVKSKARNILEVLKELDKKFDEVTVVVGSDRVTEFERLTTKYNKREFNLDKVNVVSAGERDPDAEGVSGMSASKVRAAAEAGEYDLFKKGMPRKMTEKEKKTAFDKVRSGMNLSEGKNSPGQYVVTFEKGDFQNDAYVYAKNEKDAIKNAKPSIRPGYKLTGVRKLKESANTVDEKFDKVRSGMNLPEGTTYKVGQKIKWKKNGKGQLRTGTISKISKNGYVHVSNSATAVDDQDIIETKFDFTSTSYKKHRERTTPKKGTYTVYLGNKILEAGLTKKEADAMLKRAKDAHGSSIKARAVKESLDEGIKHDRYLRSHSKKARGRGAWAFTTKNMGTPKEDEMVFISGSKTLNDAAKEAMKKLNSKDVYVMEELDEDFEFTETELDIFVEMTPLESLDEDNGFDELFEEFLEIGLDEGAILTIAQRIKRARMMKRLQPKIQRKKKQLKNRMADTKRLTSRSRKAAIKLLRTRFAGKQGQNYASLSPGGKASVDRVIQKKMKLVGRISNRLMPKVRKKEQERLRMARGPKKESFDSEFESFLGETNLDESFKTFMSLQNKSKASGIPVEVLEQVFHRETDTERGFNRVNSFISGGKARELDADLLDENFFKRLMKFKKSSGAKTVGDGGAKFNAAMLLSDVERMNKAALLKWVKANLKPIYDKKDKDEVIDWTYRKMKPGLDVASVSAISKLEDEHGMDQNDIFSESVQESSHGLLERVKVSKAGRRGLPGPSDQYSVTWPGKGRSAHVKTFDSKKEADAFARKKKKELKEGAAEDRTKTRIKKEKESDKDRHDRMLDRARLRDTQTKNRVTEEGGAGEFGTKKPKNKYKKDTPGEGKKDCKK